jgi:hypothetical protein
MDAPALLWAKEARHRNFTRTRDCAIICVGCRAFRCGLGMRAAPEGDGALKAARRYWAMTFKEYIALEREEMLRHKWIESEKAGRDLGQQACIEWAERHAANFRRHLTNALGITIQWKHCRNRC